MSGRLRVKARITTLGVQAGQHVEIDDTPAVRQKLRDGWFVLLAPMTPEPDSISSESLLAAPNDELDWDEWQSVESSPTK